LLPPILLTLLLAVSVNLQKIQEKVDDVQVQVECDVDRVIQGLGDHGSAVHIVSDVQGEDAGGDPVDPAHPFRSRNEKLNRTNHQQTQQRHEQGAADLAVELREQNAGRAHDHRDFHGGQSSPEDQIGRVLVDHGPQHQSERKTNHVVADEAEHGIVGLDGDDDADDRNHQPSDQQDAPIHLHAGRRIGQEGRSAKAIDHTGSHHEEERPGRHGVAASAAEHPGINQCFHFHDSCPLYYGKSSDLIYNNLY